MDERTRAFLAAATRHRLIALHLSASRGEDSEPYEWAIVAAFYAAVHAVNAYIWERLGLEPVNHAERSALVARVADLRRVWPRYRNLTRAAWLARYDPVWRISQADTGELLDDLDAIAAAVTTALERG